MPDSIGRMSDEQRIERAVQSTVEKMAGDVLERFNKNVRPDLTPEQIKALKETPAYRQLTELAAAARGSGRGGWRVARRNDPRFSLQVLSI